MFYLETPIQKIDQRIYVLSSEITSQLNSLKDSSLMDKFLAEIVDDLKTSFQTNILKPTEEDFHTAFYSLENLKGGLCHAAMVEDDDLLKNISKSLEEIEETVRNISTSYKDKVKELVQYCSSLFSLNLLKSKLKAGEKALENSIKTFYKIPEGNLIELTEGKRPEDILKDYKNGSEFDKFYKIEVTESLFPEIIEPRLKILDATHLGLVLRNCEDYRKTDFFKLISNLRNFNNVIIKAEKCPRMTEQMLPDIINFFKNCSSGKLCFIFEIPNSNSPFNEKQRINLLKKHLYRDSISALNSVEFLNDSIKIRMNYKENNGTDIYEELITTLAKQD